MPVDRPVVRVYFVMRGARVVTVQQKVTLVRTLENAGSYAAALVRSRNLFSGAICGHIFLGAIRGRHLRRGLVHRLLLLQVHNGSDEHTHKNLFESE